MNDVSRLARVVQVDHLGHLGHLALRLTFDDGLVRDLDFDATLHGGLLDSLRDTAVFALAFVDGESGTVAWPNGIDPDVLHGDDEPATGVGPTMLAERRLKPAR